MLGQEGGGGEVASVIHSIRLELPDMRPGGRGGVGILLYKLFLRKDANIMVIYTNREQSQGYHNA